MTDMRVLFAALGAAIPWIPAGPPPTPHPPLAPVCRAGQLHVDTVPDQGATGWRVGGVTLRNQGAPCSLVGRPRLVISPSAKVRQTPLSAGHLGSQVPLPADLPPDYSLRAIPTGAHAYFGFWWTNWCRKAAPRIRVFLPGRGGSFLLPASATFPPRCDATSPDVPVNLEVGRFVQWRPPPKASTHLPFTVDFPHLQYDARAGSVLRYEVRIRNTGSQPYTFRVCPAYQESLVVGRPGVLVETHLLNCAGARTFEPHEARVFEMRIRVPRSAAGQHSPIFFSLGLGTYNPPTPGSDRQAVAMIS